jgi:hypothetical protein
MQGSSPIINTDALKSVLVKQVYLLSLNSFVAMLRKETVEDAA